MQHLATAPILYASQERGTPGGRDERHVPCARRGHERRGEVLVLPVRGQRVEFCFRLPYYLPIASHDDEGVRAAYEIGS